MTFNPPEGRTTAIVVDRARWLAIATVCVTVVATLTTGGGFLGTIPLILGVIADYSSPHQGRWLMWVGAAFLSVTLLPMEVLILPEIITELRSYHYPGGLGPILVPFWIASILLIVWLDVELVVDAVRARGRRMDPRTRYSVAANSLVWIAALLFSVYSFRGIPFLIRAFTQGFDRPDILLTDLVIILITTAFDTALAVDAAKMWRARRMGATGIAPRPR